MCMQKCSFVKLFKLKCCISRLMSKRNGCHMNQLEGKSVLGTRGNKSTRKWD